jgi:hypothetical protein
MKMPYAEMIEGEGAPAEPAALSPERVGFQGMMTQPPPVVAQAQKPPATPEEFEARKRGWLEFINQTMRDPNVSRALGMMGISLLQPIPQGQSSAGHFGTALNVGIGAFDLGRTAQAEAAQKQAESQAVIEERQAGTALKKAQLPGAVAESKVAAGTADTRIEAARVAARKAASDAAKATTEAEVAKIEADLLKSIPQEVLRAGRIAEIDLAKQRVEEAKTRVRAGKAKAGLDERELAGLRGLDDKELRQYFTKSGPYATTASSAIVQQANMWGTLYDAIVKSNPNDPMVKGKTRERYMAEKLSEAKHKSAIEDLLKAYQVGMTDEQISQLGLFEAARMASQSQGRPVPGPGQPASGQVRRNFVRDSKNNIIPQPGP